MPEGSQSVQYNIYHLKLFYNSIFEDTEILTIVKNIIACERFQPIMYATAMQVA